MAAGFDGVGSYIAPIIIVADTGVDAILGVTAFATATPSSTPSSTSSPTTGTKSRVMKHRSTVWNDFEEVFEEGPNGKKVRVSAKFIALMFLLTLIPWY